MHNVGLLFGSSEPGSISRRSQVRWARRPLVTPLGRAVAVALTRGQVSVAIETRRGITWLLADQVDEPQNLDVWAQSGF
jgi:hypothetical protein